MTDNEVIYRTSAIPNHPATWSIYGLNILAYNDVVGIDPYLPFETWLRCLSRNKSITLLMGGLAIHYLGWPDLSEAHQVEVQTSIYAGCFYNAEKDYLPGFLYSQISKEQLFAQVLASFLNYDAIVCFLGVSSFENLIPILNTTLPEEELLEKLQEQAEWIVLSHGDGQSLEVLSSCPQALEEIKYCSDVTDQVVKNLPWFQQVKEKLEWIEDVSCCYKIKTFGVK